MNELKAININEKLSLFSEKWTPKIIAQMNNTLFKVVHIEGDFTWHDHKETDEVFMVMEGSMRIDFRDGQVTINQGELYVVPMGIEHKPYAENLCKVLLIEPAGTVNTGESGGELTAPGDVWI